MQRISFVAKVFAVGSVALRGLLFFLSALGVLTFNGMLAIAGAVDVLTLGGVGLLAWKKRDVPRGVYMLLAVPLVLDAVVATSLLHDRFGNRVESPSAVREAEAIIAGMKITSYSEELIHAPGLDHPIGLRMTIGITPKQANLLGSGFVCPVVYHAVAGGLYQAPDIAALAEHSPKTQDQKDWDEGHSNMNDGYLPAFNGFGADIPALHAASMTNINAPFKNGQLGEKVITCEVFSPGVRFYAAAPLKICARREVQQHKESGDELVVRWPFRNGADYADAGGLLMATLRDKHSVLTDPAQWAGLMHNMSVPELVKAGLSRRCVDYNYASRLDDCYCPAEVELPK
jgi:hypothetical protein